MSSRACRRWRRRDHGLARTIRLEEYRAARQHSARRARAGSASATEADRSRSSAPRTTACSRCIDECPHKRGPLSEGIVSGDTVACPLHNWVIGLDRRRGAGARRRAHCSPCRSASSPARCMSAFRAWWRRQHDRAHHLSLLRRRLRRRGRGRRAARRHRPSGQFRPAVLQGRGARRIHWRCPAGCSRRCCIGQRRRLGPGAGFHRRGVFPHSRRSTGRTRSPSTSPASS